MKSKAFTLIELLVVIAIIAILAAILFPVFAQAKLAAKKTVALSNMKNIATASLIYEGDYDDTLIKNFLGAPAACAGGSSGWGSASAPVVVYTWRHAMYPYFKSADLLRDSTNPFGQASADADTASVVFGPATLPDNLKLSMNYAANADIIGFANPGCWDWNPDEAEGLGSATSIDEPASTILFFPNRTQYGNGHWYWGSNNTEAGHISANTIASALGAQTVATWNCLPAGCPAAGFGAINAVGKQVSFAWADGHAKAKSYVATLRTGSSTGDDWGATLYAKNTDGSRPTQADRVYVSQNLFTEYK